jgi:hypothetical protein
VKEERGRGRSNLGSSNNCHFWCFASFAYLSSELVAVTCVLSPHHPSPHRDRHSHRHRHRQLAVARSPNTACMQASTTYLPCLALPCPAAASPLSNKQQFFSLCGYLSSLSGVSNPPLGTAAVNRLSIICPAQPHEGSTLLAARHERQKAWQGPALVWEP